RDVHERIEKIANAKARGFVQQMFDRVERYGDRTLCSLKQRRYMQRLWDDTRTEEERSRPGPTSKLDQLRERKNNILKRQAKVRRKVNRATAMVAKDLPLVMNETFTGATTAKMRHQRSISRQLNNNKLLIKNTRRD